MNTIDSYFEYELAITRNNLPLNSIDEIAPGNPIGEFIKDVKIRQRNMPNGTSVPVRWYQFRVPVNVPMEVFDDQIDYPQYRRYNNISDFRSIRFVRMYMKEFTEATVMRFGTLELVRSDWRRYQQTLQDPVIDPDASDDGTEFTVGAISLLENDGNYELPPGVQLEQLYNNNTVIRQNEQSLVVEVCGLETEDSRAVYKNISVDMRQYKRMRMFIHAEPGVTGGLGDDDLVGFIRMGNDLTQNYYQIEVPLKVTGNSNSVVWPEENEINIPLKVLQQIKSEGIINGNISGDPIFYDMVNEQLSEDPVAEFAPLPTLSTGDRFHRVGILGNPNFGDVRTLMVGVKNRTSTDACGVLWFNELRISDMDNEGGWAAILSMDSNIADFATVSATGRQSTAGFGTIEQGPNERSREDVKQYDVVTNVNVGQLLPKKWGLQIPFNYGQGVEVVTPKYDEFYRDIELETQLNNADAQERDSILNVNESYTKRKSINFIGVRKIRTGDAKPRFYDVENLTLNYSYNKVEHRDFEIENSVDKTLRLGANYAFNFNPLVIEPFKKNDSLFTGKYWKILKDFNVNLMPSSFTVNADINRRFNRQKFRDVDLGGDNIGLEELFRRNYTFDFQYAFNYNLTQSLQLNFTASNNNIVRNYFVNNQINGEQDPALDVWDGMFDVGDPNMQYQQLGLNYKLPLDKIPTLSFLNATYAYTGDFQWQKGSDLFRDLELDGQRYDLGNTIQNSNTHNLNTTLDMNKLYSYLGIKKATRGPRARQTVRRTNTPPTANEKTQQAKKANSGFGKTLLNAGIDILTSVKRVQVNYTENNGTFLPGYLLTPGFIGTLKPTIGYTFGSQSDIRELAARKGWLTVFPDFNQQYTSTQNKQMDVSLNLEPTRDLKIDLIGNRLMSENYTENFRIEDIDSNGVLDYNSLTPNTFGNFNISTVLIKTAFSTSDENSSEAFEEFRTNRLIIARRLAQQNGMDMSNPDNFEDNNINGFPLGYSKSSQRVLLPAFLAAYTGQDAGNVKLGAFRNVPIPNWDIKYTGLMNYKWFKDRFKRFSLTHGYRANYTINQFRTNLDYVDTDLSANYDDQPSNVFNQAGDYKNKTLYSNINLSEMFSPLIRVDMEMKNSIKILAEIKKDRMLSLSFDNNLMTEILGNEYILGLGYRFKDVRIKSKLAGPRQTIVSDLNMRADVSLRDNKTIIRYLDLDNNQVTSGQTIWNIKYSADYAFSKNLTGIFYFDYTFSEYAISTAFPQTTIRSGITLRYNFGN
ncbi:MAG TPA: cell surface protein SprA, partial [Flavobacteriaceae bacterium]|nr:cell surface protein SprA [Flavobacteriaceae bacterium]